jgi:hypothetical protein
MRPRRALPTAHFERNDVTIICDDALGGDRLFTRSRPDGPVSFLCRINTNLLYREEERELMGLCQSEGIGVIPWSLGRRHLTRPWQSDRGRDEIARGTV